MTRPGILASLFFVSGVLALVYEALWMRRFALVFGSAAPATAAVFAAYFAGLAAGSYWIGNYVSKAKSALKLYALLEVGIAVGALLVEVWLRLFESIPAGSLAAKTALAFLALAFPTICMGGTLPALGAFVDRGQQQLGRTAGLLYVSNTAGAALGVLLMPYLLLPTFGARGALVICVIGNLIVTMIAWVLKENPRVEKVGSTARSSFVGWAFFSGLVAFLAQVLWNRAFAQVHENSLHSFAMIAAVFILALAVGGQIARVKLKLSLEGVWILSGAFLLVSAYLFLWRTDRFRFIANSGDLVLLAAVVVFPLATLLGIAMPIIMQRAGLAQANSGRVLGQLLGANLLGAVLGSLTAGFLLPELLGLWRGLVLVAMLLVGAGVYRKPKLSLALVILLPMAWPILKFPRLRIGEGEKLLSISEGPHGITAVVEAGRSRRMKLNNSYVLGGTMSMGDERMQSHIPLLLHPKPESVAYMGLGTGITAGGAAFHPIKTITLVELVPDVIDAARAHFSDANMKLIDDPRAQVVVEDARNFLRRTRGKFDVVIGDLVVPWRAGEGALYTADYFQAARRALDDGALFCQWTPMFQLSREQFESVLATFLEVFPEVHIWRADFSPTQPGLALIAGHMEEAVVAQRLREMSKDPANPQLIEPGAVWLHYVTTIKQVVWRTRLNTEDMPFVELTGKPDRVFVGREFVDWTRSIVDGRGKAGQALAEFALAVSEGNSTAARQAQDELRRLVSAELYRALFP